MGPQMFVSNGKASELVRLMEQLLDEEKQEYENAENNGLQHHIPEERPSGIEVQEREFIRDNVLRHDR